jgi:hypothetical protein
VITVSGTPTTVDENYTVYLTLTNAVGTSDEASFTGVVVAEPVLQGAMVLNIGEVPVSIVTGDDTVVFFLYATPLDPLPEGYDPATDLILTFDGTPYTSLVTPFDMIPGIVPWPCALYVVHGIEAGVHSLGVSGAVNFSGLGVLYPGFTGHGSVSTHLPDVVTLDHTPTATSGNIVAQAYLMPVPVDPETYYPVPRVAFSSGGAGQGEAPVTFTHDLTAFLAGAGLSWEDIIGFGYQFPSIAVELTGPRDAPPVITATTIDAGGGAPFTTGQPASPIVTSIGTDIVWSIAAGAAPSGMSFDTDRGVFYGTPDTPGSGTVTVHAHNDYGDDEVELSWTVVDP